jgi:ADP-heptose:LPS heptosyltransferase
MDDRPRIVVLSRGGTGLGDGIMMLPFLVALRRGYPGHEIWWVAFGGGAVLQTIMRPFTSSLVDRIVIQDVPRLRRLPRFDIAFDLRPSTFRVLRSKLSLRCGRYYDAMPGPGKWRRPHLASERPLRMLAAALKGPCDFEGWAALLEPGAAARATAARILPNQAKPYVGIAPGSNSPHKNWPLGNFVELARRLAAEEIVPIFIIGPSERELLDKTTFSDAGVYCPDRYPEINPVELTFALGRRLAAAVGNDSGCGHLLAATGIPVVSLFGPTNHKKWRPRGERSIIVRAEDFCSRSMAGIPIEAVVAAVLRAVSAGVSWSESPLHSARAHGESSHRSVMMIGAASCAVADNGVLRPEQPAGAP